MLRFCHFELAVEDFERAAKFYNQVFGWQVQKWDGPMEYWMVMTGTDEPGINGGLTKPMFDQKTVNTVDVPNIDEYVGKVESAGGAVIVPKMQLPGVGWLAYCKDTEGVVFGIIQMETPSS